MQSKPANAESPAGKPAPQWDPFAESMLVDPYETYERLRSEQPVFWDARLQAWVMTGYEAVRQLLTDESFQTTNPSEAIAAIGRRMNRDYSALCKALEVALFFQNGEQHRTNRRTLTRVLTRIPLSRLAPAVEEIAGELLAQANREAEFDVYRDYAAMVPGLITARILGLPVSDVRRLIDLGADYTRVFDLVPVSTYASVNRRVEETFVILRSRIQASLQDGDESGLAIIYAAARFDGHERLTDAAALAQFLFMVATETTSSLIGSCIYTLLRRPKIYARLQSQPSLAARYVSEINRLESAVQRMFRVATEERAIGGQRIAPGDLIIAFAGAANRDPAKFTRSAEIDLDRGNHENLAFGAGRHYCLGAALSLLEAKTAVEQLMRFPPLTLAENPPVWSQARAIRRLKSLPVRFADKDEWR